MNVVVTKSYDESCAYVADMICKLVNEKPDCKLGLATGGTPVPMYKKLIEANKAGKVDFSKVRTVNLDEYCGIPETHDQSYRYFMNTNLFDHINIDKANTYVAQGMGDPEANAAALEAKVREGRPAAAGHRQQRPHRLQRGGGRAARHRPHRKADREHHPGQLPLL